MSYISNKHNKASWIERAQKELAQGMLLENLNIKNELFHHDGFPFPGDTIFKGSIPNTGTWSIAAQFEQADNQLLLTALQNGAESLMIESAENFNLDLLFDGIRLDYITTIIDVSNSSTLEINKYIEKHYQKTLGDRLILLRNAFQYLKFSNSMDADNLIMAARQFVENAERNNMTNFINLKIGDDFYFEISKLRALRIIFANICAAYGRSGKLFIYASIQTPDKDFNQSLIHYTYSALAAVVANVDFISIIPWSHHRINEARIAQNILHLFKNESYLQNFPDPMAGSYLIEDTTKQIVERIWNSIN